MHQGIESEIGNDGSLKWLQLKPSIFSFVLMLYVINDFLNLLQIKYNEGRRMAQGGCVSECRSVAGVATRPN